MEREALRQLAGAMNGIKGGSTFLRGKNSKVFNSLKAKVEKALADKKSARPPLEACLPELHGLLVAIKENLKNLDKGKGKDEDEDEDSPERTLAIKVRAFGGLRT